MKILLLSPPINDWFANVPPLGLCYIQSILIGKGYDVKMIDMFDYSPKKIEDTIRKENPDIVGISCFTYYRINSIKIAKICKEVNPNIKTILGGSHADFMHEQILSNFPEVDYIVTGEGEITTPLLIKAIENNKSIKDIDGIAYREGKKIIRNKNRESIQNLDEIPFPCYRDIELDRYLQPPQAVNHNMGKLKHTSIITSRGCPFGCQFCSTSKFWGKNWRARSPKNVVDEIEWLYNEHRIRFIFFSDDIFTLNQQRVTDICKEIVRRKLDIHWFVQTRVNTISEEMLKWMKLAGCVQLEVGVESGSPEILNTISKKITQTQIIDAFKMIHNAGIDTNCLLMVGNPNESKETIKETIELLKVIKPTFITVGLTKIFPATPLYEMAKSEGLINDDYWLTENIIPSYTKDWSEDELHLMRLELLTNYYKFRGFIPFMRHVFLQDKKVLVEQSILVIKNMFDKITSR